MVAIGARLRLVSTVGDRLVEARGFYNDDGIDYLRKRPDELLAEIHLPPAAGWRSGSDLSNGPARAPGDAPRGRPGRGIGGRPGRGIRRSGIIRGCSN